MSVCVCTCQSLSLGQTHANHFRKDSVWFSLRSSAHGKLAPPLLRASQWRNSLTIITREHREREERAGFYWKASSFFCFCLENKSIHVRMHSHPSPLLSSGEMLSKMYPEVSFTNVLGTSQSSHTDTQDEPSQWVYANMCTGGGYLCDKTPKILVTKTWRSGNPPHGKPRPGSFIYSLVQNANQMHFWLFVLCFCLFSSYSNICRKGGSLQHLT